jgi:hypothetical protein
VLSEEDVATIRRKLDEGWRGPVLLTWVRQLLEDREQLASRLRALEPSGASPASPRGAKD